MHLGTRGIGGGVCVHLELWARRVVERMQGTKQPASRIKY